MCILFTGNDKSVLSMLVFEFLLLLALIPVAQK